MKKEKCDCTVNCGDDPRLKLGTVSPCNHAMKCVALAAQQAPVQPSTKVEREGLTYRMLEPTDTIRADDEFIDDNCIDWNKPVGWEVGMRWNRNLKNARRLIPAPTIGKENGNG